MAAPPPGRSLAAGSWRHRSSPEPPPRAGGRQCRPLRQPASRRHRLQAADLGEPGREVTRWSRGAEGHRAEDAPASGRKRSLLPAAPSVGADLLRSPVWRLDLCPPKGRVDALTPAARERHLIPNRSLQRHQVKRRPETWRPMSSPRDRHTQENGRGTTHGNHGHAATCQGAPRAEGGRRGPLQPWGGGTGFCWAESPSQVICYGGPGH